MPTDFPPLRSLEWVETFLSGLLDEGFSDEHSTYMEILRYDAQRIAEALSR